MSELLFELQSATSVRWCNDTRADLPPTARRANCVALWRQMCSSRFDLPSLNRR